MLSVDNSQTLNNVKPHLRRIVKFEDLIDKNNMTQIM